ncbi:MAG: hypothetical protein ACRD4S_01060 [Candidatus Acidiferrales bacterium]
MPTINGRYYANPAYGRGVERARLAEALMEHFRREDRGNWEHNPVTDYFDEAERSAGSPHAASSHVSTAQPEPGTRWVTIDGRHVLIREDQAGREHHQDHTQQARKTAHTQSRSREPANSRDDVVLIPAGNAKPEANIDLNGMWSIGWIPREFDGHALGLPSSRYSKSDVELTESVNGGPFKFAGNDNDGFQDVISPESRTIVQRFAVDGKRVQVVLGRGATGKLIKTWDVKVTVRYPNAPVYSSAP